MEESAVKRTDREKIEKDRRHEDKSRRCKERPERGRA